MITFNNIGHYGRFGNQMFQYATLYSLAKTRKYTHGVPLQTKSEDEYHNFCLPECFPIYLLKILPDFNKFIK